MKKFLFALLLLLSLPKIIYAETITFKTVKLYSKHPKVTGSLPIIQGKGFEKMNQSIKKDILKTFDQPNWYVEMTPQKIYQNNEYLSFEMYYQISDMTSRYKSFYYTVDLKNKQIMRLNTLLEKYHVTQAEINQQLKSYVLPCLDKNNPLPDYCESMEFENIIRSIFYDKENIDLKNISSFYLKKDAIGLVFQGNKFTYPLEFNLKTRKIQ